MFNTVRLRGVLAQLQGIPPATDLAATVSCQVEKTQERQFEMGELSLELRGIFTSHMNLIGHKAHGGDVAEMNTAPLFTGSIWRLAQSSTQETGSEPEAKQYGLLGGNVEMLGSNDRVDPRIFYNVATPSSVFICGSQGSGKSHSLSCLLENCLVPSEASILPKPLTGVVFHYDTFSSDTGGAPCEAAYLSSNQQVSVRVLCAPTNVQTIKRIYSKVPNVNVEELLLDHSDLNTKRMMDLMAVNMGEMPLYLHVVQRVLRDMRIEQQQKGTVFAYADFKARIAAEGLSPAQCAPLHQRLDTLESFMPKSQTHVPKGSGKTTVLSGTNWAHRAGQLTIVDLSCPCVTAEMACSLFSICLSLFMQQDGGPGRVVALDEAHKYMTESPESMALTNNLMETIRLQRHLGARVVISTQEPSISPKLLDLCSITIVHRFSSPDWLNTLKTHLAGVSAASRQSQQIGPQQEGQSDMPTMQFDSSEPLMELFSVIVNLGVGEALVFAPSAIIGCDRDKEGRDAHPRFLRLGNGIIKMQIRSRVTADGGRSVLAG